MNVLGFAPASRAHGIFSLQNGRKNRADRGWEWHRNEERMLRLKKTQKWEGLANSLTGRRWAHIPVRREHPRFQKGISAWKKVNAFFSCGASFWAKVSRSETKSSPVGGWKAAQNQYVCAVFDPRPCSSNERKTAKTSLPDSISQFLFVKKSE